MYSCRYKCKIELFKPLTTKNMRTVCRHFLYSAVVVTIMFTACSKEKDFDEQFETKKQFIGEIQLTDEEIIYLSYADPNEISEERAIEIVRDFQRQFEKDPLTKSLNTTSYSVLKKTIIDKKGSVLTGEHVLTKGNFREQIPIYTILVSEGASKSMAYVAADERMPDVIGGCTHTRWQNPR